MDDEDIRLFLHSQLESTFPDLNLYYRPPGNLKLTRPCIVYELKAAEPSYSGNVMYVLGLRYQLTVLSDIPGYSVQASIFNIPGVAVLSNTSYVSSDIVHDVYTVSVNSI